MDMASILNTAYCQPTGMAMNPFALHLQTRQQRSREAGPRDTDRYEAAGMLGSPLPCPPRATKTHKCRSRWVSGTRETG